MKKFKPLRVEYLFYEPVHNNTDIRVVARFGQLQTAREFPVGTPDSLINRVIRKDFNIPEFP